MPKTKEGVEKKPKLWGLQKKGPFIQNLVLVVLYKDLGAKGYNQLSKDTRNWLGVSEKSLKHNSKILRCITARWAKAQILRGGKASWHKAATAVPRPKWLAGVNLTMDSIDLPLEGRRSTSKKSELWSFKENCPGTRYMVIFDLKDRVRGFWGPYSPKTYDAHWVLDHQDTLDTKWKGACIVGDCHFSLPKDTLENVKIITPVPEPGKKQPKLSEATKKCNAQIRQIRA
ncbi:hypothetical protein QOT17_010990 [Balamuthia mandrillaris]